jgi:hypothetical protein
MFYIHFFGHYSAMAISMHEFMREFERASPPAAVEVHTGPRLGDPAKGTSSAPTCSPVKNSPAFDAGRSVLKLYSSVPLGPLTAARVFRDCSLRKQSSPPERRACRILMRQAALKWRRGLPMGDL